MRKLILLLFCIIILVSKSAASDRIYSVKLQWQEAATQKSEESLFLPSLYFSSAVFSDTLPQVPVFVFRLKEEIPHFESSLGLEEKEIVACSPEEVLILRESGFEESEFVTYTDKEGSVGDLYSRFHIIPVRKKNGVYEKLLSFDIVSQNVFSPTLKHQSLHQYPESSVLATGEWYRICVDKDGIYRLTAQNLSDMGINPGQVNKSTIRIFGNGGGMLPESNSEFRYTDLKENSIWVSGGNSGVFGTNDYIVFYGQSPHQWKYDQNDGVFTHQIHYYSEETCYFLNFGQEQGKRVGIRASSEENHTHTVTDFYDYAYHQRELNNLLGSGKIWFGETFDMNLTQQFSFNFSGINTQVPIHIRVLLAARSSVSSSFTLEALGQTRTYSIGNINIASSTGIHARTVTGNLSALAQGDNINLNLKYNRTASGGAGWLNYIAINVRRNLAMNGDQLLFRNPSVTGQSNISRFEIGNAGSDITVWDVTNPFDIKQQQFTLSGNTATFKVPANILREFSAFRNQNFLAPKLKGKVPNQNLHADELHDLFIVVPDIFRNEAQRLANFRRDFDGLSVKIVSPQQIYNEFSSGVPDISAIRNYLKMFYDRATFTGEYPKYLLLFGNGTYDNKNVLNYGGNFIPTFQTLQSLNHSSTYISDDFFGLLDDFEGFDAGGSLDLGIGRLPMRTLDEARFIVDKILRYNQRIDGLKPGSDNPLFAGVISNYADWRNLISIIADDEDANVHFSQSESIANYLAANQPVYNVEKIYLDAYEQVTLAGGSRYPDVNRAINNRVTQGALLVNYIGHGGTKGLAHERILTFDDILSWKNFYNLPIFMTATCEFSSFDQPDPNELSAGVRVFLKPDGGAVALFTTTRLAYSHSNFTLNDAFMRNAFKPMENGKMPRLGDLIRIAKVQSSSNANLKNFVLLGDPSMQMAYPKYEAITTSWPDTMKALDYVTVTGEIIHPDGTLAENYNGIIYPTIYDKKATYSTLGNDSGSTPREFTLQNRILYKGTSSIENGRFSFTFLVPRDISYNSGFGKISYYFDDGVSSDGNGYFSDFIVAGTASDYVPDDTGPEISIYINNRDFKSGGKTGPNPILLAYLTDESGLNTTGQIGHDMVAFLNGNTSNPVILNNFYQADINSHRSGRVVYPFFNLPTGNYTLTLRAWDVHNNPSTASIDFIVTSAPEITLSDVMNFPNPMSTETTFSFKHNKPASELNVRIDIYNLNGKLVRTLENRVYSSGFETPIEWDGTNEDGGPLSNGIYLFRVRVSTGQGDEAAKSERLIILR